MSTGKQYCFAKIFGDPRRFLVKTIEPFYHGKEIIFKAPFGTVVGFINSFQFKDIPKDKDMIEAGKILSYPEAQELDEWKAKQEQAVSYKKRIITLAQELDLQMNISHVLVPLLEEEMVIFFTAPERVDFRELLQKLRLEYRHKITLLHISNKQRQDAFIQDPHILI